MMTLLHYKRLGYTFGDVWSIALAELATELLAVVSIALAMVVA